MTGKIFVVNGIFKEKQEEKKFSKEITAINESFAKEKAFSMIGSKHKLNRHRITINEISEKKK
ncbi:MAG: 50S ribosomal protein L18a [Candidatus Diapherotrites archaeon]|uniref:Large ribosomal subunit protein eL20 n=1 Tax=Candidatus Iainarchaeum sp. TaxID=3101447 RepID=A0A2D6LQ48_9ARCH|nr:50S ribosomal protein L18a [Candidatus Diapherotrites archaeon]|tara:strand:- start:24291 stop:24479 length:189 start_codon:yes stop_codon:yes gene_type:complete